MLRDDFSERINRVIRGFAVYIYIYIHIHTHTHTHTQKGMTWESADFITVCNSHWHPLKNITNKIWQSYLLIKIHSNLHTIHVKYSVHMAHILTNVCVIAISFQFPNCLGVHNGLAKQQINKRKPEHTSLLLPFAPVLFASAPLSPLQFLAASEAAFQILAAGGVLVPVWNFNNICTTNTVFCKFPSVTE